MSGSSPEWLALREPADQQARSEVLTWQLSEHFAGRNEVSVIDLGCGAGSTLRGTAGWLPDRQSWLLVDYDPELLVAARQRLTGWADESRADGRRLILRKGTKALEVDFAQADLKEEMEALLAQAPDLVTASALFDLVSEPWLDTFTAALTAARIPLYTVLSYDGQQSWAPPHRLDAAVVAAFNDHQRTDKGFGPAAGAQAAESLGRRLTDAGFRVSTASSPWLLGAGDHELMSELAGGIATAAQETHAVSAEEAEEWLSERQRAAGASIGHTDLLAIP
ncbi:class I SAM-dependent methyltransferase [Arthrobacter sp. PAMC25284]|uniref:class I SAM-dependent methyltransferase n=1 Tax=Arthrobacter sp. PAMC25284 TaxID=2861279 RepID=UPI001C638DA0|nr:class I SAM-dependent methyltransferase [Arthrobacter sp. PAMC25284]QYF90083.1 class I SAM-dependent methyltransferase [Arthrobacter sp. PAMC25284]